MNNKSMVEKVGQQKPDSPESKKAQSSSEPDPESYGLGQPGSQAARRERGPYFVRNGHGFVGKPN